MAFKIFIPFTERPMIIMPSNYIILCMVLYSIVKDENTITLFYISYSRFNG